MEFIFSIHIYSSVHVQVFSITY